MSRYHVTRLKLACVARGADQRSLRELVRVGTMPKMPLEISIRSKQKWVRYRELEKSNFMEVGPMLVYCWTNVVDGGPTVNQS